MMKCLKKLVAIIRIAVPFTGLILSTRETANMRKELLKYGVISNIVQVHLLVLVDIKKEKKEKKLSNLKLMMIEVQ